MQCMEDPLVKTYQTITIKETEQLAAYTTQLELAVASLLKTVEQLEKELTFVIKKNIQLENTEIANTIALLKNPLVSRKEFRV